MRSFVIAACVLSLLQTALAAPPPNKQGSLNVATEAPLVPRQDLSDFPYLASSPLVPRQDLPDIPLLASSDSTNATATSSDDGTMTTLAIVTETATETITATTTTITSETSTVTAAATTANGFALFPIKRQEDATATVLSVIDPLATLASVADVITDAF